MSVIYYDWNPASMLEVILKEPDDFLKIKETLTRIGIASKRRNVLWQSCHILHKQGKYFIVHFKELFCLDGKSSDISTEDIERRNAIAALLQEWGLLTIVDRDKVKNKSSLSTIKIVAYKEKKDWELVPKYQIGVKNKSGISEN
jgi:hypothetical protein